MQFRDLESGPSEPTSGQSILNQSTFDTRYLWLTEQKSKLESKCKAIDISSLIKAISSKDDETKEGLDNLLNLITQLKNDLKELRKELDTFKTKHECLFENLVYVKESLKWKMYEYGEAKKEKHQIYLSRLILLGLLPSLIGLTASLSGFTNASEEDGDATTFTFALFFVMLVALFSFYSLGRLNLFNGNNDIANNDNMDGANRRRIYDLSRQMSLQGIQDKLMLLDKDLGKVNAWMTKLTEVYEQTVQSIGSYRNSFDEKIDETVTLLHDDTNNNTPASQPSGDSTLAGTPSSHHHMPLP